MLKMLCLQMHVPQIRWISCDVDWRHFSSWHIGRDQRPHGQHDMAYPFDFNWF